MGALEAEAWSVSMSRFEALAFSCAMIAVIAFFALLGSVVWTTHDERLAEIALCDKYPHQLKERCP